MKHGCLALCILGLVPLLGAAPPGGARAGGDEAGFVPLFNGKDLAGWRVVRGRERAWGVEEGHLVCLGEGGGSWLGTARPYADFVLRLEFRLTPESNSGVYLRAPADHSHISRTGLEIQ